MSLDSSENVFVTRLAASPYRDVDEDFIRFRDETNDDAVKSIVASVAGSDASERDRFRMTTPLFS